MDELKKVIRHNKTALLYGPNDIRIKNLPLDELRLGEVLVKIEAATTCGTDIKTFKRGGHPQIMKSLPSPFGHEMAGVIEDVADNVFEFEKGDRVVIANSAPCHKCFYCKKEKFNLCEDIQFINGAYAQYIRVPSRFVKYNLHKIPDELSFEKASLSEPLACVLYACERLGIQENETVAVVGTGPMAFLFLQMLLAKGAKPVLIGRNETKLSMARAAGAESVINSVSQDVKTEINRLTEGYGVDAAIEAVGKPETWKMCVDLVCRGGRVCYYGGCAKGTRFELDTYRVHYDEITVMGVFHYTPQIMQKSIQMLADDDINTELFLSETRRLEDLHNIYAGKEQVSPLKFLIKP